ncbi:hypothetical protein [Dyella acidisoli]|uniref:Oligosaccharide repeat unit polymerase n=1 Tax=Dyella acidisoli TaxID=1867834 RepID=A0ABQ5XUY2_9GAMM|nr:hypothetical protein [Dyella acidisoli]GLQ95542.1 hypothetical protein GCM10007901_44980 [Dyella acidisoli]
MSWLLRLPSTYLVLPVLLACGLTLYSFDMPDDYLQGVLLLATASLGVLLIDLLFGPRLPLMVQFRQHHYAGTREAFVALAYAVAVGLFCLLDLALFPIPLITNPSSYATMEGGHEHIRHISDMCWTLPPIGLLCARNRWLRWALITVGVVFPVLVIDRNRIFASLFALAMVLLLRRGLHKRVPWLRVVFLVVLGGTVFSVLGMLRSGSLDTVTLPFSDAYRDSPQGVKWLLLYISAGPYNFGAIFAKHYTNAAFLVSQLMPGAGAIATADTDIPLDAPNINVGTEFFPFLMAFGPIGAMLSIIGLYALLAWSVRRLQASVALFPLLIFLRVAYVCLMSPFAPQAYTFTNGGFIAVCLVLQVLAVWLPNRNALPHLSDEHANYATR